MTRLPICAPYTRRQLWRFYCRLYDRMTEGDGYQPFGYDWVTMRICRPGWYAAILRLNRMWEYATNDVHEPT